MCDTFSPLNAATAMNAAAVDDVIAWSILAVVLGIVRSAAPQTAVYTIVSTVALVLAMAFLVCPALERVFLWLRRGSEGEGNEVTTPILVVVIGDSQSRMRAWD